MKFIKPVIVGAHKPMNIPNLSFPTIKKIQDDNSIDNNTLSNNIYSDVGILEFFAIMNHNHL